MVIGLTFPLNIFSSKLVGYFFVCDAIFDVLLEYLNQHENAKEEITALFGSEPWALHMLVQDFMYFLSIHYPAILNRKPLN